VRAVTWWLVLVALAAASCRARTERPAREPRAVWHRIGAWSGRGNAQLETFVIERWDWRVQWQTRNENPPGQGRLVVTAHSADSGRVIAEPIDVTGVGQDTEYLSEQPRRYYLVVDSANLDWSLTVEEPTVIQ